MCLDDSADEEPTSQSDHSEIQGTLKTLASKLDDLSTCNDLIAKHGAALQRSLSELEALRVPLEGGEKIKAVNERATLFRITSNAMINVSADHLLPHTRSHSYSVETTWFLSLFVIINKIKILKFLSKLFTSLIKTLYCGISDMMYSRVKIILGCNLGISI